jgi:hypothetical protein
MIATAFSGPPAQAQLDLDMNRITCGDWLSYDYGRQEFVRHWMSGFYSAARNYDLFDFKRLQKNSAKVMTYCQKHRGDPLPKAINKNAT